MLSKLLFVVLVSCSLVSGSRLLKQSSDDLDVLMLWGEHVYYVSTSPADYQSAASNCQSVGAELLKMSSPYESFTVGRRFAGSDFGDHLMDTYRGIDWNADNEGNIAVWIGNSQDGGEGVDGLVSQLQGENSCIYLEPRVKYFPDGMWKNDVSCSSPLHYVCRAPLTQFTAQSPAPVFAALTLDCAVSAVQLNIQESYTVDGGSTLLVFIPYPDTCPLRDELSSTAVTVRDMDVAGVQSIKYFIVDSERAENSPVPFEDGLVTYVNNIDEIVGNYADAEPVLPVFE